MTQHSGQARQCALRRVANEVLTSDAGLDDLYERKGDIGIGAQAGCVLAIDRRTGVSYALQLLELEELDLERCEGLAGAVAAQRRIADAPAEFYDEVDSARLSLVHECLLSPTLFILVCELAPTTGAVCDDLLTLLQRRGRLAESDARRIFTRLVLATKRAHDCGAVLRNIKPEVVQVRQKDKGGEYELCIARMLSAASVPIGEDESNTLTGLCGTPEYAAPEVAIWFWQENGRLAEPPPPYGPKADVWALGMVLHVMLCGCFPFQPETEDIEELLRAINTAGFAFDDPGWRKVSESALDLTEQLLQRDPSERPFLEEVLQHPFCAEALQEVMANDAKGKLNDPKAYEDALAAIDGD